MTPSVSLISRQGLSCLLGSVFLGFCCLSGTVSAKPEKAPANKSKTTQNQSAPSESSPKTDKKQEPTPQEDEKTALLDVREKEIALDRMQSAQKCTAAELELKKNMAQEKLTAARKDLDFFLSKGKERAIAAAKLQLTRAHDQYEYKKEELGQLKQMYTEDQLTDTSEEIVLKRCTRETEDARFDYDGKVDATRFEIDVKIPRREQELKNTVTAAQNELERASLDMRLAASENTLALDKARAALEKARTTWENKKKELTNSH